MRSGADAVSDQYRRRGTASTAVNGVYRLMQDERTQSHPTLYRHCSMVLRDEELDVDTEASGG